MSNPVGQGQWIERLGENIERAELRQALVGLRYTRFGFSEIPDNGYFNPKRLQSLEATTQLWGRLGRGYFDLHGGVGREEADPGIGKWVFSGEAKVTQPLTQRVEVEAYLNSFSSRAASVDGFSRTTLGLALRTRW